MIFLLKQSNNLDDPSAYKNATRTWPHKISNAHGGSAPSLVSDLASDRGESQPKTWNKNDDIVKTRYMDLVLQLCCIIRSLVQMTSSGMTIRVDPLLHTLPIVPRNWKSVYLVKCVDPILEIFKRRRKSEKNNLEPAKTPPFSHEEVSTGRNSTWS